MTPREAAAKAGYSQRQINHLIRQGVVKARKKPMPGGFYYDISEAEVEKLIERGKDNRGWRSVSDSLNRAFSAVPVI